MHRYIAASIAALIFMLGVQALAVDPYEVLEDPVLEQRARALSQELRCVVCQNESIDDSNAELARDMRRLVRQRVTQGDSDEDVLSYMVERYGDFVLLRPQFKPQNYVLWFGPFVLLLCGAVVVRQYMRQQKPKTPTPLSEAEQKELAALMAETNSESAGDKPS
ncbi:MAG: cytochrome c-type biogenesis protein CcmH [Rhodospirillaceae bacterium]